MNKYEEGFDLLFLSLQATLLEHRTRWAKFWYLKGYRNTAAKKLALETVGNSEFKKASLVYLDRIDQELKKLRGF